MTRRLLLLACLLALSAPGRADVAAAAAQAEARAKAEAVREAAAHAWLVDETSRQAALRGADEALRRLLGNALGPEMAPLSQADVKGLDLAAVRNAVAGYESALVKLPAEPDLEAAGKRLKQAAEAAKIRLAALEKEAAAYARALAKEAPKRQPKLLAATMEARGALLELGVAAASCRARVEQLALAVGQAADAAQRQSRLVKPPAVDKPPFGDKPPSGDRPAAPTAPPPR